MGASPVVSANPLNLDLCSHRKCLTICCIVTVSSFQFGLDYALIGGFMAMPGFLQVFGYFDKTTGRWAIDPVVQQLISSLLTIGTFVGSLLVGPFSSKLGRRQGLWGAALLNFLATGLMIGTTDLASLYFARFVLGISVGWFTTFAQVYINEVSPAHLRGVVFGVYQAQISIGTIVGTAVNYGTHSLLSKNAYRIPLTVFFVAPALQSVALFFFPESPRWLATQGREADAETALRRLRGANIDEAQFQTEFEEIRSSTAHQLALTSSNNPDGTPRKRKMLFLEMFRGTNLRRTGLSVAIICFHAANGSSWVNTYGTYFFTVAGASDPFGFSILATSMGLAGVLFSLLFVRRLDRRVIVMLGVAACGLCQLAFAVVWTVAPGSVIAGKAVTAFVSIFTFCYVAYAPYAWLMGGEYPSNHLRAHTYGLGTALNFLGNWLGVFTAPYFINPASLNWGARYGYIWFAVNMLLLVYTWLCIPETRDRTLEEIHEMFEARVPARKFKGYVTSSTKAKVAVGTNDEEGEGR